MKRGKKISAQIGGWLVAVSRWFPVFPEVVACMTGLTRMPASSFYLALASGSLPLGFIYASVGSFGTENPTSTIILSVCAPLLIWFVDSRVLRTRLKES